MGVYRAIIIIIVVVVILGSIYTQKVGECITELSKQHSIKCKWKITRGWNNTQKKVNEGKYLRKALNTFPLTYNIFYIKRRFSLGRSLQRTRLRAWEMECRIFRKPSTTHVFILAARLNVLFMNFFPFFHFFSSITWLYVIFRTR